MTSPKADVKQAEQVRFEGTADVKNGADKIRLIDRGPVPRLSSPGQLTDSQKSPPPLPSMSGRVVSMSDGLDSGGGRMMTRKRFGAAMAPLAGRDADARDSKDDA
ncbi:hypothetical protein [Streptomyces cyaneofuscatus]|uniref:hypothetical protein n=1 Tax=Streptomyces cyaneofuscatus TaxID=66883 RepID=UPI0033A3B5CA